MGICHSVPTLGVTDPRNDRKEEEDEDFSDCAACLEFGFGDKLGNTTIDLRKGGTDTTDLLSDTTETTEPPTTAPATFMWSFALRTRGRKLWPSMLLRCSWCWCGNG